MKAFLQSFGYAWKGLREAIRDERNIKVQLAAAGAVITSGFYFHVTTTEWCILILCIGTVIGFELLNSALENLVDLVHPEQHPVAGKVKDIAAAAVLIVSITSLIISIIIFWKYVVIMVMR